MERFIKPTFSQLKEKAEDPNTSVFTLEKLDRGFGQTIGISLRRTIMSSVPSFAIFCVKVKGVEHEYQAIKDLEEDGVQLVLNIKDLVLTADASINHDEVYELKLVSKQGVVTAGDIECPVGIEVVNKDLVIANANKDKALDLVLYGMFSKGFFDFHQTREMSNELLGEQIGLIPIDVNFSPIEKVNTQVEVINPGSARLFERLILEVTTKGSVTPKDALAYAAAILGTYFGEFANLQPMQVESSFEEEQVETADKELEVSIRKLGFSARAENALITYGVTTLEKLVNCSVNDLKKIDNLGEKSIQEIIDYIQQEGLSFKVN